MRAVDWKDQWVLVTGASAGMGRQFAVELAARGANLVLCARDEARLNGLADELNTEVRVVAADLSTPAGVASLLERTEALDVEIQHVINNAGVGGAGHFVRQDVERLEAMTALNCTALLRITHHFLPRFVERGEGGFLQVASTASFQPVPYMAVYGATKAYVLSLSTALAEELKGTGVRMTTLCPGPVQTEFQERAGYALTGMQKNNATAAEDVIHAGLEAYENGRWTYIPGATNSLQTFLQRFFPLKTVTKAAALVMKRSGRDQVV